MNFIKLFQFLTIKHVPHLFWRSPKALTIRPPIFSILVLILGLVLFGLGEALLIAAGVGVSPWTTLAEGISLITDWTVGFATFIISFVVLLAWIPLRQKPGIGTILNAILISVVVDITIFILPYPETLIFKIIQVIIAMFIIGIGSGFYLIANLGPGPRDGLMTGLQRKTKYSFTLIRTILEISAVLFGFLLGGVIGLGTVLYAIMVGPSVSLGFYVVGRLFK